MEQKEIQREFRFKIEAQEINPETGEPISEAVYYMETQGTFMASSRAMHEQLLFGTPVSQTEANQQQLFPIKCCYNDNCTGNGKCSHRLTANASVTNPCH
jgi:hypothetical protein